MTLPWFCAPNYLTCRPDANGDAHLLRYADTGYRADVRRLAGHAFLECRTCSPSTYIFAVFATTPSPMVTCFQISRESYKQWVTDPSEVTVPTEEMLYRLQGPDGKSLHPFWRPTR